jgi:hypothetical protein
MVGGTQVAAAMGGGADEEWREAIQMKNAEHNRCHQNNKPENLSLRLYLQSNFAVEEV